MGALLALAAQADAKEQSSMDDLTDKLMDKVANKLVDKLVDAVSSSLVDKMVDMNNFLQAYPDASPSNALSFQQGSTTDEQEREEQSMLDVVLGLRGGAAMKAMKAMKATPMKAMKSPMKSPMKTPAKSPAKPTTPAKR